MAVAQPMSHNCHIRTRTSVLEGKIDLALNPLALVQYRQDMGENVVKYGEIGMKRLASESLISKQGHNQRAEIEIYKDWLTQKLDMAGNYSRSQPKCINQKRGRGLKVGPQRIEKEEESEWRFLTVPAKDNSVKIVLWLRVWLLQSFCDM